jgi:hypothetical protein
MRIYAREHPADLRTRQGPKLIVFPRADIALLPYRPIREESTLRTLSLNHEKLAALREIRNALVGKANPPTSTLVGVAALFREDALVEIEAVAVIPER